MYSNNISTIIAQGNQHVNTKMWKVCELVTCINTCGISSNTTKEKHALSFKCTPSYSYLDMITMHITGLDKIYSQNDKCKAYNLWLKSQ